MARPRTDIRERIVRAGRAVFRDKGVDGAPLRAIARRARTSIGMVYYYFPSKEELFDAVIEAPYAALVAELAAVLAAPLPVRERIRGLYRRIGAMSPDELEVAALVVREALMSPPRRARILGRFFAGHVPLILGALTAGQREGDVVADVPAPILMALTGGAGIFPQVLARIAGAFGVAGGDALADRLADLLFDGIGAGAAGARAGA